MPLKDIRQKMMRGKWSSFLFNQKVLIYKVKLSYVKDGTDIRWRDISKEGGYELLYMIINPQNTFKFGQTIFQKCQKKKR